MLLITFLSFVSVFIIHVRYHVLPLHSMPGEGALHDATCQLSDTRWIAGSSNTCGRRWRLQCKVKKEPNVSWTRSSKKNEIFCQRGNVSSMQGRQNESPHNWGGVMLRPLNRGNGEMGEDRANISFLRTIPVRFRQCFISQILLCWSVRVDNGSEQ